MDRVETNGFFLVHQPFFSHANRLPKIDDSTRLSASQGRSRSGPQVLEPRPQNPYHGRALLATITIPQVRR
jgi:hypothetical protein